MFNQVSNPELIDGNFLPLFTTDQATVDKLLGDSDLCTPVVEELSRRYVQHNGVSGHGYNLYGYGLNTTNLDDLKTEEAEGQILSLWLCHTSEYNSDVTRLVVLRGGDNVLVVEDCSVFGQRPDSLKGSIDSGLIGWTKVGGES